MAATQPTFNEVFDMACMLPRQEQQMLLDKVAGRLYVEQLAQLQERKAHIEESERQIAGVGFSVAVWIQRQYQSLDEWNGNSAVPLLFFISGNAVSGPLFCA